MGHRIQSHNGEGRFRNQPHCSQAGAHRCLNVHNVTTATRRKIDKFVGAMVFVLLIE